MIQTKKELQFYIAADRIMAGLPIRKSIKHWLEGLITPNYISKYLESMRYVSYYSGRKGKSFSLRFVRHKKRYSTLGAKLGFSIGHSVFGYGLCIPHYGTIVVNSTVKAGNYCVLHTSTCIGSEQTVIGNGLYLASGGLIMSSKLKLGDNVSIAANSLVNSSIPQNNVLVAGTPAQIKKESQPWYVRDGIKYEERIQAIELLKKKFHFNI